MTTVETANGTRHAAQSSTFPGSWRLMCSGRTISRAIPSRESDITCRHCIDKGYALEVRPPEGWTEQDRITV